MGSVNKKMSEVEGQLGDLDGRGLGETFLLIFPLLLADFPPICLHPALGSCSCDAGLVFKGGTEKQQEEESTCYYQRNQDQREACWSGHPGSYARPGSWPC